MDLADPSPCSASSPGWSYETTYADEVAVGDWVQRCHGDPRLAPTWDRGALPVGTHAHGGFRRITYDGLAHDWAPTDAIRIGHPGRPIVAAQERKTGAA